MAAELVGRNVNVIVAIGPPTAQAVKAASSTIPTVFFMGSDPVQLGLVASLNRPGGNITGVGALIVNPDPFLLGRCERIAALALRNRVATIFHTHEPVVAGGLISYGASFTEGHRQVGVYTGRILKGEKPADLPVMQSIKFETAINLRTAKVLGLTVPSTLLVTADEVIE
jgi:ABC-type uncharacterized transport system substrate-binding protein